MVANNSDAIKSSDEIKNADEIVWPCKLAANTLHKEIV